MRKCPNCGHEVPEQAKFCGFCGTACPEETVRPEASVPSEELPPVEREMPELPTVEAPKLPDVELPPAAPAPQKKAPRQKKPPKQKKPHRRRGLAVTLTVILLILALTAGAMACRCCLPAGTAPFISGRADFPSWISRADGRDLWPELSGRGCRLTAAATGHFMPRRERCNMDIWACPVWSPPVWTAW